MQTFPLFLSLRDRRALVVGGTDQAARKIELLLSAGAQVSLIADTVTGEVAQLITDTRVTWAGSCFSDDELLGVSLVIVATEDESLQARVSQSAQSRGIPVNVVDGPALSSFIMPAIVDRGPVTVAISTGGAAPALARKVRAEIERALPAALGRVALFADIFREQVRRTLREPRSRRRFWDRVFEGRVAALALAGDEISARRELIRLLDGARGESSPVGMVHLVGAGPGDPDLLTLKAHRLLQGADVVVYDQLVSPQVLALARRDAERVYVGKRGALPSLQQAEINRRLVALAHAGKNVVRLKGGDPLVFGRGGEEIEALARAGVTVEVVPGITAALGCAASAGIPLTHRLYAPACVFVTAHLKDGDIALDWPMLARPRQTVVVYMGIETLPLVARQLVRHGLSPATPVALIESGTTEQERRIVGTLATIEQQAVGARLHGPTLCVLGEVVGLALSRDKEIRFESRVGL
ncbi:uroporphyrinogen-III C-methyltransferase /precorrin-2 dehydrogenase [Enhydrobacter aerosaccus]|uniref:Uroporphyrinogen-III C-methyltransferase /precorrin-2 dehydrogenase n=1 Tax=Enhydrobacter aerosaccus TaxID=225324 RepID=A0A1T4QF71_9HYPH|nr:siroheme synthase CysG [Enhydrobacter aerosaccus]SKA02382.1 uroporphyrinogen-III C-methyltransferase /precorrin-2 dehydrogenase [Enhydrobacter aerosaccus]